MALLRRWAGPLAVLLAGMLYNGQHAAAGTAPACQVKSPPLVHHLKDAYKVAAGPGATLHWYTYQRWSGPGFGEIGQLTLEPGAAMGIHKHLDGNETQIVVSGSGEYSYWAQGMKEPVTEVLGPGSAVHHPMGALHKMVNTGSEPWVWTVFMPTTFSRFEFYDDWPASLDAPGNVVEIMPWDLECPKGQEPVAHADEL